MRSEAFGTLSEPVLGAPEVWVRPCRQGCREACDPLEKAAVPFQALQAARAAAPKAAPKAAASGASDADANAAEAQKWIDDWKGAGGAAPDESTPEGRAASAQKWIDEWKKSQ